MKKQIDFTFTDGNLRKIIKQRIIAWRKVADLVEQMVREGGTMNHEHMCPQCGIVWRCAEGEPNVVIDRWCSECIDAKNERGD